MDHQFARLLILLTLLLCVTCGALGMLVMSARTETTGPSETTVAVEVTQDLITAGVILAGDAGEYGWEDVTSSGSEYAETIINGNRVIVYEQLNNTDHPGVTLELVIGSMVERGAQTIFIAPDYQAGAEITQVDQRFPDTVLITNVAMRANVVALLPALTSVAGVSQPAVQAAQPAAANSTESENSRETGKGGPLMVVLIFTIIITVGGVALWRWPRMITGQRFGLPLQKTKGKSAKRRPSSAHTKALMIEQAVKDRATDFNATGEQPPILQKLCTYVYGDYHFDESFAIELPSREFLGECGIGIATPVNRTDATRITALEIWMFDKNDIKTTTGVLASQYAATNHELTKKLEPKGQVILADTDAVIEMQTKTLRLRARVLDMVYGFSDTFPTASFFDHIVIEIAVWKK